MLTNAGIISALQHDQIFAAGTADEQLIEDEANVVAAKAAASVRRSRRFHFLNTQICHSKNFKKVELPDSIIFLHPFRILSKHSLEKPRFGLRKAAGFQSTIENSNDGAEEPNFSGAALFKYSFCLFAHRNSNSILSY